MSLTTAFPYAFVASTRYVFVLVGLIGVPLRVPVLGFKTSPLGKRGKTKNPVIGPPGEHISPKFLKSVILGCQHVQFAPDALGLFGIIGTPSVYAAMRLV
jgi:hypothetical protein